MTYGTCMSSFFQPFCDSGASGPFCHTSPPRFCILVCCVLFSPCMNMFVQFALTWYTQQHCECNITVHENHCQPESLAPNSVIPPRSSRSSPVRRSSPFGTGERRKKEVQEVRLFTGNLYFVFPNWDGVRWGGGQRREWRKRGRGLK
jgi:hypothetical protein